MVICARRLAGEEDKFRRDMSKGTLLSIICPVLNEERAIPLFYERLLTALGVVTGSYEFELIFVNNRSTDGTLQAIHELRKCNLQVHVLTLSRNFGYEASVATGLRYARGAAMAVIDVDCEDPPEMIPKFIHEWEAGNDIVYGQRGRRPEPLPWQLCRKAFYRLNRLIADSDIILDMAEFFLISAAVRDAILANHSTVPFLRSEVAYVGFQRAGIPYARQKRIVGKTHYNLWRATKFAVTGILSSSTFPLRLSVYAFPVLTALNLGLFIADKFSLLVMLDFLYVAFFMMVICVYVARTYKDVIHRPMSVVDWRLSTFDSKRP
jgi:dolichol-phosphate mannosyltransferase